MRLEGRDNVLAPGDRGGAGADGGVLIVESAFWPCCVTFRPILTSVHAITDTSLSRRRVWGTDPVRQTV